MGDAEATEVGPVTVRLTDAYSGRATAAFTVPELPAGAYRLMLCDTGCSQPLADVIPTEGFTVVADPATARMGQRVDRPARRIRVQAGQLAAARADDYTAARDARSELEHLQARVSALAVERRSAPRTAPWAYAGWLVAAALAVLVLSRRPSRPARVVRWHADEQIVPSGSNDR